jgi:hypothetical protein
MKYILFNTDVYINMDKVNYIEKSVMGSIFQIIVKFDNNNSNTYYYDSQEEMQDDFEYIYRFLDMDK